jgi:hypothetical protein
MNRHVASLKAATSLTIAPLTLTIGAEISGLDLAVPLEPDALAAIKAALLDRKVLFFRGQDITTEQHLAFARNFGELEVHPFAPHKPDYPQVLAITHEPAKPRAGEHLAQRRHLAGRALIGIDPQGAGGPRGGGRYPVRRHGRRLPGSFR